MDGTVAGPHQRAQGQPRGVWVTAEETPQRTPREALAAADAALLQAICERYGICDVQVFGRLAKRDDQPGDPLELLFRGPDVFSGFTLEDQRCDLEDLIGVDVELVSNHPNSRGLTMDSIRASAVQPEHVLGPGHGPLAFWTSAPHRRPATRRQ